MKGATRKKLKYDVEEEKWGMEQPAPCKPPPLPQVEEELGSHEPPPSLMSNMAVGMIQPQLLGADWLEPVVSRRPSWIMLSASHQSQQAV